MKTINLKISFKTKDEMNMENLKTKIQKLITRFSGTVNSSYPENENTIYVFSIQDFQKTRFISDLRGFGIDIDDENTLVV